MNMMNLHCLYSSPNLVTESSSKMGLFKFYVHACRWYRLRTDGWTKGFTDTCRQTERQTIWLLDASDGPFRLEGLNRDVEIFWTCQSFGLIMKILSVRTIRYAAEIFIFCQSKWNFVSQILWNDFLTLLMWIRYIWGNTNIDISDVPIIGNNRLIDRKAVDYDDRFSIINNRSPDACTKDVYNKIHMHNKAT